MSEGKREMSQEDAAEQAASSEAGVAAPLQEKGQISEGRRRFTRAGLLASPILMSVAARPVFGAPCISNMLSGNLSNPGRGQCVLGADPVFWRDQQVWPALIPPDVPEAIVKSNNPSNDTCGNCVSGGNWICGGTPFKNIFSGGDPRPMYQILCEDQDLENNPSEASAFIAAILNAGQFDYVLKPMQVIDLWNGNYVHVTDKRAFLIRTWTNGAWDGSW